MAIPISIIRGYWQVKLQSNDLRGINSRAVATVGDTANMNKRGDDGEDDAKGSNNDDFYMVLPSNSCGTTHPENTAAKYHVSWKNPIVLKESQKWAVALIEANMEYPKFALMKDHSILYHGKREIDIPSCAQSLNITLAKDYKTITYTHATKTSQDWVFEWWEGSGLVRFRPPNVRIVKIQDEPLTTAYYMELTSPFEFSVSFPSEGAGTLLTMSTWYVARKVDGEYYYQSDWKYFTRGLVSSTTDTIDYIVQFAPRSSPWSEDIYPKETITAKDSQDLCHNVAKVFHQILEKCELQTTGMLTLKFKPGVRAIEFKHGLHKILGFDKIKYVFANDSITNTLSAEGHPQLNLGIQYVYIYSSLSQPINVGGEMLPLLRSVCLEGKHTGLGQGQVINHIMDHPMYIPVSQSIINSVEINIRSNSGELIPFGEGTVTTLTLHFKKRK